MDITKIKNNYDTLWNYKVIIGYTLYRILRLKERWEIYNPLDSQELVIWNDKKNCSISLTEDNIRIQSSDGDFYDLDGTTIFSIFLQKLIDLKLLTRLEIGCWDKFKNMITDSIQNNERFLGRISDLDFKIIQKIRQEETYDIKFSINALELITTFKENNLLQQLIDYIYKYGQASLVPWLRDNLNKKLFLLSNEYSCFCNDKVDYRSNSDNIYYHYEVYMFSLKEIPEKFPEHITINSMKRLIRTSGGVISEETKVPIHFLTWRDKKWDDKDAKEMLFIDILNEGVKW